jgi:hypothetical protein
VREANPLTSGALKALRFKDGVPFCLVFSICMCMLDDAGMGQHGMLDCVVWFKGKDGSSQGNRSHQFDTSRL